MIAVYDVTRLHRGGRRAIVLGDTALRRLADFFMLVRGDDGNVGFFKSRDEALDWLEGTSTGVAG